MAMLVAAAARPSAGGVLLLGPAAAGERSPPERLAAAASVTPTHGSAVTRPAVEAGRVELTFPSGETLSAQTFALQNASRVLKEALSKPLATPGVLTLGKDDCLAAWSAVVQMAEMSAYPPELVNWDTLAGLLRLADTYDMPVVGAACADFIARNKAALTLSEPLTSTKNVLVAATLCGRYSSGCTSGCNCVEDALVSALSQLVNSGANTYGAYSYSANNSAISANSAAPRTVATRLKALIKDEHYDAHVSPAVQVC
ncbi:hypothetical protein GPECTOR_151g43 [Gonium pectorale]|uniref:BTB domain-containing protein n=1 Tax=Gonium pectorale TaxID=33097 RepID=A0A150FXQ8_GONPE|nr:hypothetical protein GPECTOR_151g43 [Gonium pectorale]|eukprot:KXZ42402.1 hypothetical protein GPECTOR_151g43 [Gonium pectorale]